MNPVKSNKILLTYSESSIRNLFRKSLLNKRQVSEDFFFDKIKIQQLEDELVNKAIAFRDACIYPLNINNTNIIQNHFLYLHDPFTRSNAQVRGPQCDLASRIFRDCAMAGNDIQKTSLSALDFNSNLFLNQENVASTPSVNIPNSYHCSHSGGFKEGLELSQARVISAVNSQEVIITNDSLIKLPRNSMKAINNLPYDQNIADYYRVSGNKAVFEDIKNKAIGVIYSQHLPKPGSNFTGTITSEEEYKVTNSIASKAKKDVIYNSKTRIRNLNIERDSIKNKIALLEQSQKNHDIKSNKDLIGLASVYSNKFYSPINYKTVIENI